MTAIHVMLILGVACLGFRSYSRKWNVMVWRAYMEHVGLNAANQAAANCHINVTRGVSAGYCMRSTKR